MVSFFNVFCPINDTHFWVYFLMLFLLGCFSSFSEFFSSGLQSKEGLLTSFGIFPFMVFLSFLESSIALRYFMPHSLEQATVLHRKIFLSFSQSGHGVYSSPQVLQRFCTLDDICSPYSKWGRASTPSGISNLRHIQLNPKGLWSLCNHQRGIQLQTHVQNCHRQAKARIRLIHLPSG